MRVAFITPNPERDAGGWAVAPGGSSYHRCLLPAAALAEFGGHEAWVFDRWGTALGGEIVPVDQRGFGHHGWDVVVLQYSWMNGEMVNAIERARSAGQTVISDVDDHFRAVHWSHQGFAYAATDPGGFIDHCTQAIVQRSSHVTVSTPFLADVFRGLGQPNVTVLRNMIDLRMWHRQPVADRVRHVGWVGLTSQRSRDLEQLGTSLRRFMRAHPSIKFLHAGEERGRRGPRN